ncbi:MAG: endolytic transglycosylase MltG [Eubacteriales bacterium]|nr:endolytic transglycosylase MltG [Eubacteriales bacterium]MDD4389469.1 endolytic transglycosylase MltG [Eubacteriales bacterium]
MSSRKRGRRWYNKKFIILAAILIIVAAIGMIFIANLDNALDSSSEEIITVNIPAGSSTSYIGRVLEENGIIESASKFKLYSKINSYDGKLKAGEYNLSPSMQLKEIMSVIIEGKSNTARFTVPEGYTVNQTADKLASENLVNKDEFMKQVKSGKFNYEFIQYLPNRENRLEGFLFPETYEVYTNATEERIVDTMLSQFDSIFKDEYYERADEMGYSLYDIITIASLIERETRVDDERAKVASVIYNRLDIGMKLQIDATVQYALGKQKERLLYKDLEIDSPYNTYKHDGLPLGPICSPGEASIRAALYPADTEYYYYVLKSKNETTHNFAKDGKEFKKYEAAYKSTL